MIDIDIDNTFVGGGGGPWITPPWMPPWILPPVIIPPETVIVDTFYPPTTIVDPGTTIIDTTVVPPAAPPVAIAGGDGGEITIFSPETNEFVMSYTLNESPYEMQPGEVQTIINDRTWTIEFIGSATGVPTRYTLSTGRYKFKMQDGVVGLFATRDVPGQTTPPPAPPTAVAPAAPPTVAAPLTPPTTALPAAPEPGVSTGTITIFIRPENRFQMVYALNNEPFTMKPGEVQEFDNDRTWTIQYLGSSTGTISTFTLDPGFYEFVLSNEGVELRQAEGLPTPAPAAAPAAAPPAATPAAPAVPPPPVPVPRTTVP